MKGTLHKTESGWVVKYYIMRESSHAIHPNEHSLPLHSDAYSVNGPMKDVVTSWEGKEVEFEIVDEIIDLGRHGSTVVEKAKLLDKWVTMKEGDITVNFKPMPEFDDPKYPDYPTRAQQIHIQIAEECFRKYPNNKELYTTDELKDAYKAGVIDGLKEWTLDSYDRPKYPEVKIICPRCKAIMPCACNTPGQTSLLNIIRSTASWISILKEFISANSQTKPLTFECWLVENYNPPTKKEDHDK
jgi:hypothetical protein